MDFSDLKKPAQGIFTASLLAWGVPGALASQPGSTSSVEDLVHGAGRVVVGKVRNSRSEYASYDRGSGELILTRHHIEVSETFKGPQSSSVEMVTEGGTIGDITLIVPDSPSVQPGEEIVVFLNGGPEGWTPQGGRSGILRVEKGTDRIRDTSLTLADLRENIKGVG